MNDPIRLLDGGGGASARERDVLRAGRAEGPTSREKQALWTAIAAQSGLAIPAASAQSATNAASAGATSAGGTSLAVKSALVAIALGGGVFATARAWPPASPPPPGIVVASPAAQPPPPARPPAPLPPTEAASAPRAAPARPARPQIAHDLAARAPAPSRLAAEGRAVVDAKRALRADDAASALRLLEAADRAFPDGALGQEREALMIEALDRAGQREAARARARAFLRAYPTSPHATNVRRFAGER
jgi:hypothetical protein